MDSVPTASVLAGIQPSKLSDAHAGNKRLVLISLSSRLILIVESITRVGPLGWQSTFLSMNCVDEGALQGSMLVAREASCCQGVRAQLGGQKVNGKE